MQVSELSPREVFSYFSEISAIPHGSGNTGGIADYCVQFAKKHSLEVIRDDSDNVIIFKKGSVGYENHEPVILQGHLDMVCEKESDSDIDMSREGVRLCTDGEKVWADKTTLGADDGIAVAYILAILASDKISHPPIQALLTSDEEIGMLGARALDTSVFTAKRLINIDSETEGVLFVSCAGGIRTQCDIPVEYAQADDNPVNPVMYEVAVSGLAGGHSGVEIHKQHTNAIRLIASALSETEANVDIRLSDISGGGKENAIPKEAKAVVCISADEEETFVKAVSEYDELVRLDLAMTEPNVRISTEKITTGEEADNVGCKMLTSDSTRKVLFALQMSPDGVYKNNPEIEGMVQTSLNMGTAYIKGGCLTYKYLIRSNTATGKKMLLERVTAFVRYLSGSVSSMSDYPAWEYKKDSKLRDIMHKSFCDVYGHEPEITSVHAGLECGILSGKMPDVDMISFGPTLVDVHTPNEHMDVASVRRSWTYLLEALELM